MQFVELKQHLNEKQFLPAYMVVGEDAFLRSLAADMFKGLITQLTELNLSILTAPDSDRLILEAAESLPFMSDIRVVMVYEFSGDMQKIIKYLNNPCPSTVLVFVNQSLESNFAKAAKLFEPVECDRLSELWLKKWIGMRVKQNGCNITEDAATVLIDYCAKSLTRIVGETDKLCAFKLGGTIESNDVKKLVSPDIEIKIYELSDAISSKNAQRASIILNGLLYDDTPVVNLMGLLYAHFRRLLYCSVTEGYPEMAADLKVKEYAVKKSRELAAKYSPKRLKKICDSFHKADYDFKSGRITDIMALNLFIMETMCA